MIEYLILLWLTKYRDGFVVQSDPLDSCLDVGAGIDFEPPVHKRPDLRVVK